MEISDQISGPTTFPSQSDLGKNWQFWSCLH